MAPKNAFENVATEATAAETRDMLAKRASSNGDAHLFSGNKVRYRREFTDPTLSAFDVVTGTGMTVTAGTGSLVITSGTTANQTTTVTTKQHFTAPFKAAFGVKASGKVANTEVYVKAVAVNDDGTLDESVLAAWRIAGSDSTTTNIARVETRNGGSTRSASGNITTVTQTSDSIFEAIVESGEVQFHTRGVDSSAARSGSTTRNSVAPDPTRMYALRYHIATGTTAPASSITFTSQFLTAIDYTEINTEMTGGPGSTSASQAMPVHIAGGGVSMTSTGIHASSSVTGTNAATVLSAASTNATVVKNTAGRVYGYQLANTTTSWRYLKLFNTTTAPVVGTTVPLYTVPIPPGTTSDLTQTVPLSHSAGISYSITANPADIDTTAVGAGDVVGYIAFI